jgi:spore germination protein YaaH
LNNRPTSPLLVTLDSLLEGQAGSWVINLFVIPLLVIAALILPPLALPQRVLSAGYTGISSTGGSVSLPDGTQFVIPAGVTKTNINIKLDLQPQSVFLKSALAQDLPPMLDVKSGAYQPSLQGAMPAQAILSIPIPEGVDPFTTLDVYGYSNKKWSKLPFQMYLDEQKLDAYLTTAIPQAIVLVQTGNQSPTISVDLNAKTSLPSQAGALLAEVNPVGLTLAENGGIAGSVPDLHEASASSPYQVLPTVSNFDGESYDGALVDAMLKDATTRKQHIQTLVDLTVEKLYPGLNIDYQNVDPANKKLLTTFVRELAQALHAKDKILSVTMALPAQISVDTWDTGAFDWDTIGQLADIVKLPLPNYRDAYVGDANAPVRAYLDWAVGRVDRYKLQLTFSLLGRDEFGSSYAPISFSAASKLIGQPELPANIVSDTKVTLDLPKLRDGGIKFDAPTGAFYFNYKDDKGFPHTVYIETADSFAKKVALAFEYNLRGIALRDVLPDAVDARVWDAVKQYREAKIPKYQSKAVIVWRVNGQKVGTSPANDPRFTWTVPAQPGDAKIEAALSFDEGQSTVGTTATTVAQIVKPAPTPAPTPVPAAPRPTTAAPAAQPAAPASTFRGKNLFAYGAQLNWTGSPIGIAGEMQTLRGMGFTWAKVQIRWCEFEENKGNIQWARIDELTNTAAANGVSVLFSILCGPKWTGAVQRGSGGAPGPPSNPNDLGDFVGAVASRYCGKGLGAIEVWNETNMEREWGANPVSGADYIRYLQVAYTRIKQACPSIVVVSAAPTPTGVTAPGYMDDVAYLHQMYQAGLKNYSDAIGVHPSGFCNAPDARVGAPNVCGGSYNNHRSFFFRETMEAYRAVMVQYGDGDKQLWPTEFGWASAPNPHPDFLYAKNISLELQAQWLEQAYRMMKAWGWVGVAILWNLDFTDLSNETGAFHVLGRPAQSRLAAMPK